jgi:Mor family transcriptional regulator
MAKQYLNAAKVLPAEILKGVSKALGGKAVYLWVPAAMSVKKADRDAYAVDLFQQGYNAAEIADRLFVSVRTVRRILAKIKREAVGQPSRVITST